MASKSHITKKGLAEHWNYQDNMKCDYFITIVKDEPCDKSVLCLEILANYRGKPSVFIQYL